MKIPAPLVCLLGTLTLLTSAVPTDDYGTDHEERTAARQIAQMQVKYRKEVDKILSTRHSGCTSENVRVRQEWGSMTKKARREYIEAVQCLQKKPPRGVNAGIPGSQNRFDDFAGTHIQQTPFIHFDGLFLPFHRGFVHLYEQALRDECGYSGTQPYWDWTLSYRDPRRSTVFDGGPWSMGGNGRAVPHGNTTISAFGLTLSMPPGTGGGCVEAGPFAGTNVSLGPVVFEPRGPDGGLGYNPRCLSRDLNLRWSPNTRPTKVLQVLTACADVGCFDTMLEDIDGVHAGGHFTVGGLGIDAFSSAGDPVFWLHHGMVDRLWTLWQAVNLANRTMQTAGTGTAFNEPPSPPVTLDTELNFGVLAPRSKVRSMASPIDGPFCYVYA